jgi:glutamate synthase domain-containing protein 3
MHPLVHDLDKLKDAELENRINELTRKYFATYNFDVQQQIIMILESYKEELAKRQRSAYEKMMNSRNKDLDKLIKVS